MINQGEEGPVAPVLKGVEEDADVFGTDDVGKRLVALGLDLVPDAPLTPEVVAEETFECLLGLVDGRARQLLHILTVNEEILHLSGSQIRDAEVRIVLPELAGPPGIAIDGFWPQSCKLDKAQVVLIPLL